MAERDPVDQARADLLVAVGIVALATAYWLAADAIPSSPLSGTVGADGLPKTLAWVLGGLAALLGARAAATCRRLGPPARPDPVVRAEARRRHLRALGMLGLGVGYVLVVPYLGYALAVFALGVGTALYNGAPRTWRLVAGGAVGAALFYLLFVQALGIPLPAGVWPGVWKGAFG